MFLNLNRSTTIEYHGLEEISRAAREIIDYAADIRVWLFEGEMGAGKTTLIKEICRMMKVEDHVSSPTYSLVNEYRTEDGKTVYHFDFYRIKHQNEALDIGADEYFYSGDLCMIEWPSMIPDLLPQEYLQIDINIDSTQTRKIKLTAHEG
jgi:tRNA threonylcarbamoyladenosine biosynthesis protein TsaE